MVEIVIRRSDREVRERAHEAPSSFRGKVTGYARGLEEADRIQRERGRDNPNSGYLLVDDQTAVESTRRTVRRTVRAKTGVDIGD